MSDISASANMAEAMPENILKDSNAKKRVLDKQTFCNELTEVCNDMKRCLNMSSPPFEEICSNIQKIEELIFTWAADMSCDDVIYVLQLILHSCIYVSSFAVVKEGCSFLNQWLTNSTVSELLVRDPLRELLVEFGQSIYKLGDYEAQVLLLETLIRVCGDDYRERFADKWFLEDDVISGFINFNSEKFDEDCRILLNLINQSENGRTVYSVEACSIVVGETNQLEAPPDMAMWVDFNYGSLSISFTFMNSQNKPAWESICLANHTLSSCVLNAHSSKNRQELVLILNPSYNNSIGSKFSLPNSQLGEFHISFWSYLDIHLHARAIFHGLYSGIVYEEHESERSTETAEPERPHEEGGRKASYAVVELTKLITNADSPVTIDDSSEGPSTPPKVLPTPLKRPNSKEPLEVAWKAMLQGSQRITRSKLRNMTVSPFITEDEKKNDPLLDAKDKAGNISLAGSVTTVSDKPQECLESDDDSLPNLEPLMLVEQNKIQATDQIKDDIVDAGLPPQLSNEEVNVLPIDDNSQPTITQFFKKNKETAKVVNLLSDSDNDQTVPKHKIGPVADKDPKNITLEEEIENVINFTKNLESQSVKDKKKVPSASKKKIALPSTTPADNIQETGRQSKSKKVFQLYKRENQPLFNISPEEASSSFEDKRAITTKKNNTTDNNFVAESPRVTSEVIAFTNEPLHSLDVVPTAVVEFVAQTPNMDIVEVAETPDNAGIIVIPGETRVRVNSGIRSDNMSKDETTMNMTTVEGGYVTRRYAVKECVVTVRRSSVVTTTTGTAKEVSVTSKTRTLRERKSATLAREKTKRLFKQDSPVADYSSDSFYEPPPTVSEVDSEVAVSEGPGAAQGLVESEKKSAPPTPSVELFGTPKKTYARGKSSTTRKKSSSKPARKRKPRQKKEKSPEIPVQEAVKLLALSDYSSINKFPLNIVQSAKPPYKVPSSTYQQKKPSKSAQVPTEDHGLENGNVWATTSGRRRRESEEQNQVPPSVGQSDGPLEDLSALFDQNLPEETGRQNSVGLKFVQTSSHRPKLASSKRKAQQQTELREATPDVINISSESGSTKKKADEMWKRVSNKKAPYVPFKTVRPKPVFPATTENVANSRQSLSKAKRDHMERFLNDNSTLSSMHEESINTNSCGLANSQQISVESSDPVYDYSSPVHKSTPKEKRKHFRDEASSSLSKKLRGAESLTKLLDEIKSKYVNMGRSPDLSDDTLSESLQAQRGSSTTSFLGETKSIQRKLLCTVQKLKSKLFPALSERRRCLFYNIMSPGSELQDLHLAKNILDYEKAQSVCQKRMIKGLKQVILTLEEYMQAEEECDRKFSKLMNKVVSKYEKEIRKASQKAFATQASDVLSGLSYQLESLQTKFSRNGHF